MLEASIEGAHGVLLSISGGSDLGLFEINEAARLVTDAVHPEANVIFGAVIDDSLGDEVRVTVIAAGFDGGQPKQRSTPLPARSATEVPLAQGEAAAAAELPRAVEPEQSPETPDRAAASQSEPARPRPKIVFDDAGDDELDVPDFLK